MVKTKIINLKSLKVHNSNQIGIIQQKIKLRIKFLRQNHKYHRTTVK